METLRELFHQLELRATNGNLVETLRELFHKLEQRATKGNLVETLLENFFISRNYVQPPGT